MKYGLLNTRNPKYNEMQIKKFQLLYAGGDEIKQYSKFFIPKLNMETERAYHDRLQWACYTNYFQEIVNNFSSNVMSKQLSVVPAADADDKSTPGTNIDDKGGERYREFAKDADKSGNSLANVIKDILTESMSCGLAYIGIDFPASDQEPGNYAEEELMGLTQPYTYCVPTLSVIDWECDDFDNYLFVVLKEVDIKRKSPSEARKEAVIRFTVWNNNNGVVTYEKYEIVTELRKDGSIKEPKDEMECLPVKNGKGTVSFKKIPIVCLKMPKELNIGNLIGDKCASIYCRYSTLVSATARNMNPILCYRQGAEFTNTKALSAIGANPTRGQNAIRDAVNKGMNVTGPDDEVYWAEPTGSAYKIIQEQIEKDVDEIHRISHQIAQSVAATSSKSGKSAQSKQMDHQERDIVLTAYAALVKDFVKKLYDMISAALKEDVEWQAMGMDNYKTIDEDQLLQLATQVNKIAIPSKTFKKHHLQQIAMDLCPNMDPQIQQTIKDEIDKALETLDEQSLMNPINAEHQDPAQEHQNALELSQAKSKVKPKGK